MMWVALSYRLNPYAYIVYNTRVLGCNIFYSYRIEYIFSKTIGQIRFRIIYLSQYLIVFVATIENYK